MNEINWFVKKYPEKRETIIILLEEAEKKHHVTAGELQEGCYQIRLSAGAKRESLRKHITMLCFLADKGIKPKAAGKKIRKTLLQIRNKREERLGHRDPGKVNLN